MDIRVIGPRDKAPENCIIINVTSRSTDFAKQLSPMILGPVRLPSGQIAKKMENAWQYSKVYATQVDSEGNPSKEWHTWSSAGFNSTWAERYPMGKGAKPLYAFDGTNKLDYITARRNLYFQLYRDAVQKSPALSTLLKTIESAKVAGKDVCIFDFDGYDSTKLGKNLGQVLNDDKKIMGHGFVLQAMLLHGVNVTPDIIDTYYNITPNINMFTP